MHWGSQSLLLHVKLIINIIKWTATLFILHSKLTCHMWKLLNQQRNVILASFLLLHLIRRWFVLCGRSGHSVRTCTLPGAALHRSLLKLHTAPSKQERRRPPRTGQATPRKAKWTNASEYSGRHVQLKGFHKFSFSLPACTSPFYVGKQMKHTFRCNFPARRRDLQIRWQLARSSQCMPWLRTSSFSNQFVVDTVKEDTLAPSLVPLNVDPMWNTGAPSGIAADVLMPCLAAMACLHLCVADSHRHKFSWHCACGPIRRHLLVQVLCKLQKPEALVELRWWNCWSRYNRLKLLLARLCVKHNAFPLRQPDETTTYTSIESVSFEHFLYVFHVTLVIDNTFNCKIKPIHFFNSTWQNSTLQ